MSSVVDFFTGDAPVSDWLSDTAPERARESDAEVVTRLRNLIGRKFEGGDIEAAHRLWNVNLYKIAEDYAKALVITNETFEWLADTARAVRKGGRFTDRQAAGVLNCWARELGASRTVRPSYTAPVTRTKAPVDDDDAAYDAWIEKQASGVSQGFYTVVNPAFPNGRVTIKIGKWGPDKRRPGRLNRWISYLTGPINTSDYTLFARQGDNEGWTLMPAFRQSHGHLNTALMVLFGHDDAITEAREAYALESGHCARCNRLLTVPASIHRGLGSECASKV